MTFSTTAYFLGLLTIIIPIVIHLWSKKTRKTIPFGTIRFLSEDDAQAIKSLIPTEWFLLCLRVMILVVLILILSEPLWPVSSLEKELVLIDPDYKEHPNFEELRDSLEEHTDVRWFSRDFPSIEDSLPNSDVSHWELLRELEKKTAKITVISPRRLIHYVGLKPKTSFVNWVSLPQENQTFEIGIFTSGSGTANISGVSNQQSTYFSHSQGSGSLVRDSLLVTVAIQADDAFADLNDFILASIEAINEDSPLTIRFAEVDKAEWLIWLRNIPAPKRRNLMYATSFGNRQVIDQTSEGAFAIAAFDLETFLTNNFPIQLEQVLSKGKIDTRSFDWRELSDSQLPEKTLNAGTNPLEVKESRSRWFWAFLLIVFIAERYLSLKMTPAE